MSIRGGKIYVLWRKIPESKRVVRHTGGVYRTLYSMYIRRFIAKIQIPYCYKVEK